MLVMIKVCDGFNLPLKYVGESNCHVIYTYYTIKLKPGESIVIKLPYQINTNKYINFEIDKSIALVGGQIMWHNLNDKKSSGSCLEFLLRNSNANVEMGGNSIAALIGADCLNIKPETIFGKIFI